MLEQYFFKPSTIDRLRWSWIATEIEAYVAWLAEQGYGAKTVWRRVPIGFAFGEFARERGARTVGDLPAHVEAFVAAPVAASPRDLLVEAMTRKEVRGPVEQMLSVVVAGFGPTGRPHHRQPFVDVALGSSTTWPRNEDFARHRWSATTTTYASSRRTFGGSGVKSIQELSPVMSERVHRRTGWCRAVEEPVRGSAGALRVVPALRTPATHPRRRSERCRWLAAGLPVVERPRSISWDDVNRVLASVERRTIAGRRNYAILLLLVTYGLRARGDRRTHLGRHRLEARAPGDSRSARPVTQLPFRCLLWSARPSSTTYGMAARPQPTVTCSSAPSPLAPDRQRCRVRPWPALTCSRPV